MPKTGPDTPRSRRGPAPAVSVLGQNQYGKAEVRVVRVVREGAVHHLRDLNVSIALSGALDDVHLTGSNANCLPTDTMKNTVYVFAKEHGIASPEEFATRLARHFVTTQPSIHRAGSAWRSTPGTASRTPPQAPRTPSPGAAARPASPRSRTRTATGR